MSTTTTTEWTVKPGHIGMGPSVIDASGNVVCHIPAVGTHAERMQLANRIAAMPDLVAMLKAVVGYFDDGEMTILSRSVDESAFVDSLRSLLARATR